LAAVSEARVEFSTLPSELRQLELGLEAFKVQAGEVDEKGEEMRGDGGKPSLAGTSAGIAAEIMTESLGSLREELVSASKILDGAISSLDAPTTALPPQLCPSISPEAVFAAITSLAKALKKAQAVVFPKLNK